MAITRTPIIDDDGSGRTGTVIDNSWKQEFYNQIDAALAAPAGVPWKDIPFAAGNFTTQGGGTWTVAAGDQVTYCYVTLFGYTVHLAFYLSGMTLSGGTPVGLLIKLPTGLGAPNRSSGQPFHYLLPTGPGTGVAFTEAGSSNIRLLRDVGGTAWPAMTGFYLVGHITIPYVG